MGASVCGSDGPRYFGRPTCTQAIESAGGLVSLKLQNNQRSQNSVELSLSSFVLFFGQQRSYRVYSEE